ncbi:MAG: TonB-dependent receptor [Candidatus Marinimicrobia bacterium]|nr:TonB-dependent receptor [Candidatus Neomarinimicrobiota bacterium]MBT3997755.1 TonB-dependent receptor [Candidatus Neomarinimicrobiota bacterium]MBT4569912.1 TonB-dependent receptor [Candidatus Neomarinimicrobiota bacterium]MBT4796595.1 TonB-dependent receptor [Candidatus Neomarinimicrobiota bacterium]MBT5339263.1 TonB-dependent receptor [Candidatus Neomarinimicrobiota bacterium]
MIFFLMAGSVLFSQSGSISGIIKNERGNPLVGANVFLKNTALGSATDKNGNYVIPKVPAGKHYQLTAMYIGHRTVSRDVQLQDGEEIKADFILKRSLIDLDEVVVSASFSERQKRAQASPVTIISEEDLRVLPLRSIDEVLLGKVPGGYANLPHRPGQNNYAFTLRGGTSGAGRPLGDVKIYVDGVELLGFDVQSNPGITDFIDPSDIERIEVVRGPMGSTLHGSNAQSGIIHIFTKRGSNSRKTTYRIKIARKSTDAPIINDKAMGQEVSFNLSGRSSSDLNFNFGVNGTVDEEVMPSNGKNIEQIKLHGALNARIGTAKVDVKTFQSWGRQGFISNLFHLLKYKEERGWTDAPDHWDDPLSDGFTEFYKPGLSINFTQNFTPNWYHTLIIGNDTKQYLYRKFGTDSGGSYLKQDWNRTTLNYFWHLKRNFQNLVEFDITAGAQRTQSSNVRLSGTVDEVKDQYYYDDFDNASLVDQSNSNLGYYAETVLGYRENLYLTLGGRVEENEYFGKDYGTHFSPQMGISLISELGSVIAKLRGSWGGGGISPPQSMQALPSESSTSINIGNPDLKPERQSGYEVGGDFYFGDNFFLEVTYFDQLFRDGIQNDPSIDDPETVKREYWYINFGEIINKGWEFALKTRFGPLGINATYSILDSRWGQDSIRQNDLQYEGFFDEGVRRNDVPTSTANLSLTYNIPPIISKNKKGGSLVLDFNYIGDKKGRDWLLQYDGFYNPNVDYISYYSKDLLVNYKPYVTVRLRWNYWFTRNINIYFDVRNLTEHEDISSGITQPALGRQMVLGFDLEF